MSQFQRPFLKWAGGKYRLLPHILPKLTSGKRLIEPFVGAGVIFLNTEYPHYYLNDSNTDLINVFKILQTEGERFIEDTQKLFCTKNNTAEKYYKFREKFNKMTDVYERSRYFIYFNRHGYNGLCRYNSKRQFNVPFGQYVKPYFPWHEMQVFHQKSQKATFVNEDFKHTMQQSKSGDIIYCDPPYVPLTLTASFTAYYLKKFSLEDQTDLASLAEHLSGRKRKIIISNHHTDFTEDLYKKADITSFNIRRNISCHAHERNEVKELIAVFAEG